MALTPEQLAQLQNFYKTASSGNQTITLGGSEYSTIGTAGTDEGGASYKPNSLVRYIPGDTGKYYAVDPNTGSEQLVQWNKGGNLIGGTATDLGTMAATFAALYGAGQLVAAATVADAAVAAGGTEVAGTAAAGATPGVGGTAATAGSAGIVDTTAAGYAGLDAASAPTLGGGATVEGGAAVGAAGGAASFNPAADSQLANTAIDSAGGNSAAGYTAPASSAAGAGTETAASSLSKWLPSGGSVARTIGSAVLSSLLAPKPQTGAGGATQIQSPKTLAPSAMPDPVASQQLIKKSIAEQIARRGRASTILTHAGRLGG